MALWRGLQFIAASDHSGWPASGTGIRPLATFNGPPRPPRLERFKLKPQEHATTGDNLKLWREQQAGQSARPATAALTVAKYH